MSLEKFFHHEDIDKGLLMEGYKKDKQEIEKQLIPPICEKIRTDTIVKLAEWSKKLNKVGLKSAADEALGFAYCGCAAYWINKQGHSTVDFDEEKVLSGIIAMEKRFKEEDEKEERKKQRQVIKEERRKQRQAGNEIYFR